MVSIKVAVAIAAMIVVVGGAVTVWAFVQPRDTTASPLTIPAADTQRAKHREEFFDGDLDRTSAAVRS